MSDRRLRIKSGGTGLSTEIAIVEPDGAERQVPKLRRVTFAVGYDDAATATLEAVDIDLSGEGVLVGDTRHRMTEDDVLGLLDAYRRAVSNLAQVATMLPACAQEFAAGQYREHVPELRRWLIDWPDDPGWGR